METMYTIAYLSIQKPEQGRLACTIGFHQSYTGLQINQEAAHTSQQAVDFQNKRTQLTLKVGLSNSAFSTITIVEES